MPDGKWLLVTGGAKRLGRAVALEAAPRWNVAVHYRDSKAEADETLSVLRGKGAEARAVQCDLERDDPAKLIADCGVALSALVNAAAIFEHDEIGAIDEAGFARHMKINALAPSQLMGAFAKQLAPGARGAVVNFLDFKLAAPYPDHFSYTLSKYALSGATEMAARALAPNVRVNAVAPGYVLPAPGQSDADHQRLHAQTPLKRGTTAEDVARAVVFLLEADAITGQTLYLDSGLRFAAPERDFMFR